MSFGWSASSNPPFTGLKSGPTSSFADALKRLAEHVEEKNKINANHNGTPNCIQSPQDFSNRTNMSHVNNSMSPEQALRLYTQYVQEVERREDMRRNYLRNYPGPDSPNVSIPILNRRFDGPDPYRFMAPQSSGPFPPSAYFQSLAQQPRMPLPTSLLFPNTKATDVIGRVPTQGKIDEKSEATSQSSKPKSKLFRPYDLDSPAINSQRTSPSSPIAIVRRHNSFIPTDESLTTISSGKETQLFNSLGLVQQSADVLSEKSSSVETSPSVTITSEESSSIDTVLTPQPDNHPQKTSSHSNDSTLSGTLKRKSVFSSNKTQSSHRKQSKHATICIESSNKS
ncbi:unnamed protein product [Adineta ricciae]|nr:unnamed protein product [Adineta ricciae]